MFENQNPSLASATIASGNSTATLTPAAANANAKNRIYLEHVSMGAAGKAVIKEGGTQIANTLFFAAKGVIYVGLPLENSAVNRNITIDFTLDTAAPAAGVAVEATYRYGVLGTTPGSST